ncbi:restriction endonuclease subunit S [Oceanospirillaceae bacterium]|nr:restriction endonuclease subunit S [Oceanospirillaceae bacterium]
MEYPVVFLSDCCEIKPPKSEAKKLLKPDELVSFVPMALLGINRKGLALDKDKKLADVSGSYTYFADNDVLLAKITPCFENGKLGIAQGLTNGIGFGSSEFIVFRPNQYLETDYLYYFLNQSSFRDHGKALMTGAVGHKRVPKDFIQNTQIPLPPIPEQQRIVAILDQAFADIEKARANAQQNLKNARELFDSYLHQVFSQRGDELETKTLGGACDLIKRGIAPKYLDVGGMQVVNQKCIRDHAINYSLARRHNLELKKVPSERLIEKGDVLVNSTGTGTLGRVAQVRIAPEEDTTVDTHVTIVRPIKNLFYNPFFGYMMVMIEKEITESGEGASGQTELSREKLQNNFTVSFPASLDMQRQMVTTLDSLSEKTKQLEATYEIKLKSLDELKKSLLQKAFSGELTKGEGRAA